jgi:molecular chaperone GrpE
MDPSDRDTLVDQFRTYLETGAMASADQADQADQGTDLFSLFTELVAVKNEVRIQSRQMKGALDDFRGVFSTLEGSHATLAKEIERLREENRTLRRETLRPVLLDLLDLYDRMAAGLAANTPSPPARSFWGRFCRQDETISHAMREGQGMNLRRLLQLLAAQEVRPLETLGERFDPHRMRALAVVEGGGADGVVAAELRTGFLWGDELIRPAEVRVYKN